MSVKYIGIDDAVGYECWADVNVVKWVTIAEHDELLAAGYIDLDGMVLVETEYVDE